jgi:hypothetical protein
MSDRICNIVLLLPLALRLLVVVVIVVENDAARCPAVDDDDDDDPTMEASWVRIYSSGAVAVDAKRRAKPPATPGIHEALLLLLL